MLVGLGGWQLNSPKLTKTSYYFPEFGLYVRNMDARRGMKGKWRMGKGIWLGNFQSFFENVY
jgi:hypothetical protein